MKRKFWYCIAGNIALHPRLVQGFPLKVTGAFSAVFCLLTGFAAAQETVVVPPPPPTPTIVISVAEQKLVVLRDGMFWRKYPISTSKFGLGDAYGSYKTPLGQLRVCEKIGEELTPGSVIKERHATGEVLPANAPGRDPIVTRVIWLDGLEEQNHNARSRGIYIHGTTEEAKIGRPVSYGCIRMRSQDVQEVFQEVGIDTAVSIVQDKLPRFPKYVAPKPQIIVIAKPTPAPALVAAKPGAAAPLAPIASNGANPAMAGKKLAAAATPAPAPAAPALASYHQSPSDPNSHNTVIKTTEISNSAMAHAMQGSILSAGLPDGPKIPTLPEPPAPKDIPRFGRLGPTPPREAGLSLQATDLNLTPAIQAAEAAANTPAAAAPPEQDSGDSAGKAGSHIAYRAGATDNSAKQ